MGLRSSVVEIAIFILFFFIVLNRFGRLVSGFVELKIYDQLGREVATLVSKEQSAGSYEVDFDGTKLSSSVYLYRLTVGTTSLVRKMLLLK